MKELLFALCVLLIATGASATMIRTKFRLVTFSHGTHVAHKIACTECHFLSPDGQSVLAEKSHGKCKGCHLAYEKAPVKCLGCHPEPRKR